MLLPTYLVLDAAEHVVVLPLVVLRPERVGAVHVRHLDAHTLHAQQRLLKWCKKGRFDCFCHLLIKR